MNQHIHKLKSLLESSTFAGLCGSVVVLFLFFVSCFVLILFSPVILLGFLFWGLKNKRF